MVSAGGTAPSPSLWTAAPPPPAAEPFGAAAAAHRTPPGLVFGEFGGHWLLGLHAALLASAPAAAAGAVLGFSAAAGAAPTALRKIGVLGAGFMGAGFAYVAASAGLEVVLIDRDQETADKGKAHSEKLISGQIAKGRAKSADRDALLARIHATADYAALKGCDLVVEAVFEDRAVKAEATQKAQAALGGDVVFASNTSTLPIGSLAEAAEQPENFIGIHFFSPVDKMMLVEVIMGAKTGPRALATALDFVRAIKKTPIVVNDCRGFFANRCVGAYTREGHLMLSRAASRKTFAESISPAVTAARNSWS